MSKLTISSFSWNFVIWGCEGVSKSDDFDQFGHFGQKSARFIRVWGCVILSEKWVCGLTNVRLDFSVFEVSVLFWKVGLSYIWFSSSQGCPDLAFWKVSYNTTNSGYEKWRVGCGKAVKIREVFESEGRVLTGCQKIGVCLGTRTCFVALPLSTDSVQICQNLTDFLHFEFPGVGG